MLTQVSVHTNSSAPRPRRTAPPERPSRTPSRGREEPRSSLELQEEREALACNVRRCRESSSQRKSRQGILKSIATAAASLAKPLQISKALRQSKPTPARPTAAANPTTHELRVAESRDTENAQRAVSQTRPQRPPSASTTRSSHFARVASITRIKEETDPHAEPHASGGGGGAYNTTADGSFGRTSSMHSMITRTASAAMYVSFQGLEVHC